MGKMKSHLRSLRTVVVVVVLLAVPVRILVSYYSPLNGFLALLHFGRQFKATRLEEINEIDPPALTKVGYDGQFYAQMALNPLLTRNDIERALDNPTYRARRIGLPLLAFCLGVGKPAWILHVYSLLNFAFWLILLGILGYFVGYRREKDVLLAIALLWSTGTVSSVTCALPDLPAAVLGVWAVFLHRRWITSSVLLGSAALFKETAALSFVATHWPEKGKRQGLRRLLVSCSIMVVPIALWVAYVQIHLTSGAAIVGGNFGFPLSGFIRKLWKAPHDLTAAFPHVFIVRRGMFVFEVLCPMSLYFQAAYLFAKPRVRDATWRLGIGFGLLFLLLGDSVWVNQYAYCRALLPLTFSFNLLVHKYESGAKLAAWYLGGNVGMFWMCLVWLRLL